MTVYVHREAKKEVTALLREIKVQRKKLKEAPRSKPLRVAMITEYYARLGQMVEAGLIAFMHK